MAVRQDKNVSMLAINLFIFLTIFLSRPISCLKLLHFVPGLSKSHYLFNNRLACSLKEAGHEVVIVNNLYFNHIGENDSPCNVTQFQLANSMLSEEDGAKLMKMQNDYAFATDQLSGMRDMISIFNQVFTNTCRIMIDSHDVMEQLRQYKFDASLSEVFFFCNLGVSKELDLPTFFVSGGNYIFDQVADTMGLPYPTSFVPSPMSSFSDRMTFKERAQNLAINIFYYILLRVQFFGMSVNLEERELFKVDPLDERVKTFLNFGKEIPLLLLNGEPVLDLPRPISTGVHYNGELNPKSMQKSRTSDKLEQKWQTMLADPKKKGVILFSFGTVVNLDKMPISMRDNISEALKGFPDYHIIWKVNKVFNVDNADHIHVVDWVPQPALLNHKRLKLFITHGGYNSLLETCQAGVPVVTIPLFGDQFGNALRAERMGVAKTVQKEDLTTDKLGAAMKDLLSDEKYAKSAKKLASMMGDRIRPNVDVVAQQVARAVRHHRLLPRLIVTRKLNLFQYYMLDICATVIVVILTIFMLSKRILCRN